MARRKDLEAISQIPITKDAQKAAAVLAGGVGAVPGARQDAARSAASIARNKAVATRIARKPAQTHAESVAASRERFRSLREFAAQPTASSSQGRRQILAAKQRREDQAFAAEEAEKNRAGQLAIAEGAGVRAKEAEAGGVVGAAAEFAGGQIGAAEARGASAERIQESAGQTARDVAGTEASTAITISDNELASAGLDRESNERIVTTQNESLRLIEQSKAAGTLSPQQQTQMQGLVGLQASQTAMTKAMASLNPDDDGFEAAHTAISRQLSQISDALIATQADIKATLPTASQFAGGVAAGKLAGIEQPSSEFSAKDYDLDSDGTMSPKEKATRERVRMAGDVLAAHKGGNKQPTDAVIEAEDVLKAFRDQVKAKREASSGNA